MRKEDVIRDMKERAKQTFPAWLAALAYLDEACRLFGYHWEVEYWPRDGYEVFVSDLGSGQYHATMSEAVLQGIQTLYAAMKDDGLLE